MPTLFEQFIEHVHSDSDNFEMDCNVIAKKLKLYATKLRTDDALYIYGTTSNKGELPLSYNLELLAIVVNGVTYVAQSYLLEQRKEPYTSHDISLFDYIENLNKQVKEHVFPAWYDKVEPEPLTPDLLEKAYEDARIIAILHNGVIQKREMRNVFTFDNILPILLGKTDIETVAHAKFNQQTSDQAYYKALHAQTRIHVNNQDNVEDWELALAKAVYAVIDDAKTLSVTFEHEGKTDSASMEPHVILRTVLNKNVPIQPQHIYNRKMGADLLRKLNAAVAFNGETRSIYARNIVQIAYKNDVIYQRQTETV